MNTAMKFLSLAVALAISGCSGESDEAKKLGFSRVEEMKEIHQQGWHTKTRYLEDMAKKRGFASVAEMQKADEQEKLRIEAQKKAEQEELTRPWKSGIQYQKFSDTSCKPSANEVCMSQVQLKRACSEVKGTTVGALKSMAVMAMSEDKTLLLGGRQSSFNVAYGSNSRGEYVCTASFVMEGIVNGNSMRKEFSGNAKVFIFNGGELLINYMGY